MLGEGASVLLDSLEQGHKKIAIGNFALCYVDIVVNRPQPLPEMEIPLREPNISAEGEMFFLFSKTEILKFAEPFRYAVVVKFLRRRPSLDHVRGFIKNHWGLRAMPVVGQLRNPRRF